eukprot:6476780-Amphidinium_carterae.1
MDKPCVGVLVGVGVILKAFSSPGLCRLVTPAASSRQSNGTPPLRIQAGLKVPIQEPSESHWLHPVLSL